MNLGKKLRCLRQARGLSTVALAKRARVTTAFIRQLEHSHTVPSLQTLQRIAAVLEVSLPYFVLEETLQPQVVRQRERQSVQLGPDGARVSLLSPLPPQHLEVALLELPPGAVSWSSARAPAGPQCYLVVHGTVRADYGDHPYCLDQGDSILWDGTTPYRLANIGPHEARLLIATAPASLWQSVGEEASQGTSTPGHADRLDMRPQGAAPTAVARPASPPAALVEPAMGRPDGLQESQLVLAYQHVKERPKLLHAMTGLTPGEFEQVLPHFQRAWEQYLPHNCVARDERLRQYGGRKPATLVNIEDKLLFILYYVKLGPLQEILAFEFGMVQSTAHEWIRILSEVLQQALAHGGYALARAPKPLKKGLLNLGLRLLALPQAL